MNEMRKLMEAVNGISNDEPLYEALGTTVAFAFFHVDDYGRPESEIPYVVVSVESTGDRKEDESKARALGVAKGIPDLKTGFLVPQPTDGLQNEYDKSRAHTKQIQKALRAVAQANAKPNTFKIIGRD